MNVGENIKRIRTKKGYTAAQFAELVGVSPAAVSKWETGKGFPRQDKLEHIAKALSCTVSELYGFHESDDSNELVSLISRIRHTEQFLSENDYNEETNLIDKSGNRITMPTGKYDDVRDALNNYYHRLGEILQNDRFNDELLDLLETSADILIPYGSLNDLGKQIAIERVQELTEIPRYKKEK